LARDEVAVLGILTAANLTTILHSTWMAMYTSKVAIGSCRAIATSCVIGFLVGFILTGEFRCAETRIGSFPD
jgi:hypothetical protein